MNSTPNNWAIEETNTITDLGQVWIYKFYFRQADGTYLQTSITTKDRITFTQLSFNQDGTNQPNNTANPT